MANKSSAAIDVLALIIIFFGFVGDIARATNACRFVTNGAFHHDPVTFCHDVDIKSIVLIFYPVVILVLYAYQSVIAISEILTSNSSADVKPLSLNECDTFVSIHSALSISGLKPCTLTGISG